MSKQSDLDVIKNACALIKAGAKRGTGYLVSPYLVVTCEHVVDDITDNDLEIPINVVFGEEEYKAIVLARDQQNDCAILELSQSRDHVQPLSVSTKNCNRGDTWDAYGFPELTNTSGSWLKGDIQDPEGEDPNKVKSVVLFAREIAAAQGTQAQGFSGTPVLSNGVVIGHLKRIIPNSDDRAEMGTLYASPVQSVISLLPQDFTKGKKLKPQPAITGYDPSWYINRDSEEKTAIDYLKFPGSPVIIYGTKRSGKTTILKHLLNCVRQDNEQVSTIITMNVRLFDKKTRDDLDLLIRELANTLIRELFKETKKPDVTKGTEWINKCWQLQCSPLAKITELMEIHILPEIEGRLILAIDEADVIWKWPSEHKTDFFGMFRTWVQKNGKWEKLRLILTIATEPSCLIESIDSSPFNINDPINLLDFDVVQVGKLANKYGLEWSEKEIKKLMDKVGGHPYLIRLVMYKAASEDISLEDLLKLDSLFEQYLENFRSILRKYPDSGSIFKQFNDLQPRAIYKDNEILLCRQLVKLGLLVEERRNGRNFFRLRYFIYQKINH